MGIFGKSAQQERIDGLAFENAELVREARTLIAAERERSRTIGALRSEIESLRESSYGADRTAAMYKRLYEGATKTLAQIAEQETPTANATVKRMARMARKELPVLHHDAGHAPAPAVCVGAL